ncbi:hypothetical protein KP509_1Z315400 [Ceratopteris richardii]|nr:hypothetical protein KP509_1Z315400 [Ceratopteris richardii]
MSAAQSAAAASAKKKGNASLITNNNNSNNKDQPQPQQSGSWRKDQPQDGLQDHQLSNNGNSTSSKSPAENASSAKSSRATPAKNRRRLARGPRSGEQPPSASGAPTSGAVGGARSPNHQNIRTNNSGGCAVGQRAPASASTPPAPQVEDHRVVSTHFHDGATQAIMKVTILAAGFVIGARGISARLIGQVTGAVVHSWTERSNGGGGGGGGCRPPQFSQLPSGAPFPHRG